MLAINRNGAMVTQTSMRTHEHNYKAVNGNKQKPPTYLDAAAIVAVPINTADRILHKLIGDRADECIWALVEIKILKYGTKGREAAGI